MPSSVEPITPSDAFAITPHDTNPLTKKADAIWVGVAGDVNLTTMRGTTLVFTAVAGSVIPMQTTHVKATSTTATGLRGLVY